MKTLIHNIGFLPICKNGPSNFKGKELGKMEVLENAWLLTNGEKIHSFGTGDSPSDFDQSADANGGALLPSWCDSHTHLVFATSREQEFLDRLHGLSYEEIARRGGGILNSAKRLQESTEDDLFNSALRRIREIEQFGTGAVEIKSGYGLTTKDEIKMLRVAKKLKEHTSMIIKTTFLGAHAIPSEFKAKRESYVKLIVEEMIPQIAEEKLADYCDVFCDQGFFTPQETATILTAGLKAGMKPKIHANELGFTGGIQVGVQHQALSVDHLEFTGDDEIHALLNSSTMPTLLPSTAFFLGLPYPPARKMINAGLPIALATDYNPGSSPSGNMWFVLSLASIKLKMTPEEAINAATLNGAYAMGVEKECGSITEGKLANLILTPRISSLAYIPYAFGSNHRQKVMLRGKWLE